jgi:hypothetical protein
MRTVLKIVIVGVLLTSLFGLGRASLAGAEEETKLSYSSRGGILVATAVHRFEVFFYPTGVRVFPLDAAANTVDTSRLTASATVSYPGAPPERSLSRPLHPEPTLTGAASSSLVASIGLADALEKATMVDFEIMGLPGSTTTSTVAFMVPLEFVAKPAATGTNTSSESRQIASPGSNGNRPDVVSAPRTLPRPAEATPAYAVTRPTPGSSTSQNATTARLRQRDWTTGRDNLPLARPWLPPKN